jgi:hypothetical protein
MDIGTALYLMTALPALECLAFKIQPKFRMGSSPDKPHTPVAQRAHGQVVSAKASRFRTTHRPFPADGLSVAPRKTR